MLKYLNYQIYTNEIPDELSLGFTILGCNVHCPECHSKHVWDINSEGIGTNLSWYTLDDIIKSQKGITCILFFGGEWESSYLTDLLHSIKTTTYLKTALYTGRSLDFMDTLHKEYHLYNYLDYLKVGPYVPEAGPITHPETNQRLFKLKPQIVKYDITEKFWG